jgi:outer membrane protein
MKKLLLLTLFVVLTVSFTTNVFSQLKVGIVDTETIIKEMPEAKEADLKLKELGKSYQDTLMSMQQDLQSKLEQYQKQKGMMPAEKQQEEEMALQALNQHMMQYNEEKFGQMGELAVLRDQYLAPIREKISKAIDKVAKSESINLVFDETSPSLLYAEDKFDITFRVLDEIKRGNESGK